MDEDVKECGKWEEGRGNMGSESIELAARYYGTANAELCALLGA